MIKDWNNVNIQGYQNTKYISYPSRNRHQLWWVVGLLTGHCHLKGQLFKLGLTNSPICKRCLEKEESATHILCDCAVIAYLRFHNTGNYFMEPSDYHDTHIRKVLRFIRTVGLTEGWTTQGSITDLKGCSARDRWILTHSLHTHPSKHRLCCTGY
jgi:hypothetical protein